MFEFMINVGQQILKAMSSFLSFLSEPITKALPEELGTLLDNVPILNEFLAYTPLEVILGIGLPIVLGYTLVKWLIP